VRSKTNVFSTTSRSINFTSTSFGEGNVRSWSAGMDCAKSFIVATSFSALYFTGLAAAAIPV
jgi:hypothetical protein